jgi:light-regulated signal transduction histidine kinase (bacteriophytochrome)
MSKPEHGEENLQKQEETLPNVLDSFSNIHNRQEPSRKTQAFEDRLEAKYGEALDEQSQDQLRRMEDAAGRMRMLISDLLMFPRVTAEGQTSISVDVAQMAREVVSDIEAHIDHVDGLVEYLFQILGCPSKAAD